jgi:DNA polymerase-4
MMPNCRLILHLDVDAFFASVEQLLIPVLRGRPVIVGSGCIASCRYEARGFGLHAGMSLRQARQLCPQAVVLEGDFQIYRCFAEHIWQIARRYTVWLETHLDEAYGDATGMERICGSPLELGRKLQHQVLAETGLPVSVGLAANRMMAKIASASAKPRGVVWIPPGQEEPFLTDLPVEKLLGVGRRTAEVLRDLNVQTVGQLRSIQRSVLRSMFGLRGEVLYERCRGRDFQPIRPAATPKTISRETTFHSPTCDVRQVRGMLFYLLERAMRTARKVRLLVGCVELSIRYDDWKEFAAGRSLPWPSESEDEVFGVMLELLEQLHCRRVALRHVGVVLSKFSPAGGECRLFEARQKVRDRRLHQAIDAVRDRYGYAAVVTGRSIDLLGRLEQNDYGFVLRTPSLTK